MPKPSQRSQRRKMQRSQKRYKNQLSQRVEKSPAFRKFLQKKIKLNMEEFDRGRWVSPQQAIAVSYSQTRKKFTKK